MADQSNQELKSTLQYDPSNFPFLFIFRLYLEQIQAQLNDGFRSQIKVELWEIPAQGLSYEALRTTKALWVYLFLPFILHVLGNFYLHIKFYLVVDL